MKFLPAFILLVSIQIFPQESSPYNFLKLKSDIKTSIENTNKPEVNVFTSNEDEKKSVGLGIIYSLLLPGMGELYAEDYNLGKYFTIADGLLWGTLAGMNIYSNWQKDNYMSYAASNAGITNEGKDDNYYATIGEFLDIDSYNEQKALERNFDEMYDRERFFWKWNTSEERRTYRDMWTSSEEADNNIRFVVGGLILNRIASAINAVRLISAYNSKLEEELSWTISVDFVNKPTLPTSLDFKFTTSF